MKQRKPSIALLVAIFLQFFLSGYSIAENVCPDCGQPKCLYVEIDRVYNESRLELSQSIYLVCRERGITDYETIQLIKANYNL